MLFKNIENIKRNEVFTTGSSILHHERVFTNRHRKPEIENNYLLWVECLMPSKQLTPRHELDPFLLAYAMC